MTSRTLPGLGITGFWDLGEDGWKDANDIDLRMLSALVQPIALDFVATLPGSPTNGDIHLLDETNVSHANAIAVRDNGAWVYLTPTTGWEIYDATAGAKRRFNGTKWALPLVAIPLAYLDETTALTTGTAKLRTRIALPFKVTEVRASLSTGQTSGSIFTTDVKANGTSMLSTLLTIDNTERTSKTAATPAVLSGGSLADDTEISVDITQIGDGTAKGLKVQLIGYWL